MNAVSEGGRLDTAGIGAWTQDEPRGDLDGLLNRLQTLLHAVGYTPEEVERVYWAVHERLGGATATSKVSYRVDDHQLLVRIESLAPSSSTQLLQFGILPRGGDMEWYCYDKQGDLLLLRDYSVAH